MVSQSHNLPSTVTSELAIDSAAVRGQVRLKNLNSAWAVEFDLQSSDAVEVAIDLGGTGLSFGGYAGQEIGIAINHQGETVYHGLLASRG